MEILTLTQFIMKNFKSFSSILEVAKECEHFSLIVENNSSSNVEIQKDNKFYVLSFFLDNAYYTLTYTFDCKELISLSIKFFTIDN